MSAQDPSEQRGTSANARAELNTIAASVAATFAAAKQLLTFEEWFALVHERPELQCRNAAQYVRDAMDHFGRREVRTPSGLRTRFRLFDREFDGGGQRLVAQEDAQLALYETIAGFCRLGRIDKLILMHGPNGSAKSTLLDTLQRGLEAYSKTEAGALYRFVWVLPAKESRSSGIGFGGGGAAASARADDPANDPLDARLSDETRDHPIYLIPAGERAAVLDKLFPPGSEFVVAETIRNGDLSARNRKIFDALLAHCRGDLAKLLRYVRVERFYLSRNYRSGLVDVEPKQTVDARSFPVTGDRAFNSLPNYVAGQTLHAVSGDLVDANRGLITYSDLLKRPYEHYKYLLTAAEGARVALDHVVLNLDLVLTASGNDINLLEFRAGRSAEYQSFRGRLDLCRVPYLLDYRVERCIYKEQVGDLLRGIHIAPHVTRVLALWGVMTRLRRPQVEHYPESLAPVLRRMTPLEKADLYAYGRVPQGLSNEEARDLLAAVPEMFEERFDFATVQAKETGQQQVLGDYEGSFGASVRDLKAALLAAASEPGAKAVTVPKLFAEIREYLDDRDNHRWMYLEPDGSFHLLDDDDRSITELAYQHWLDLSDREVREALGLVDEARYMELFRKYVFHANYFLKGERIFDAVTGGLQDADTKFLGELEASMAPNEAKDGRKFREDLLSRIGAWALSNPNVDPAYEQIFPDYFARLREDYYRQQKGTVARGIALMLDLLDDSESRRHSDASASEEAGGNVDAARAQRAIDVLIGSAEGSEGVERHTRETLRETLVELSRHRY